MLEHYPCTECYSYAINLGLSSNINNIIIMVFSLHKYSFILTLFHHVYLNK